MVSLSSVRFMDKTSFTDFFSCFFSHYSKTIQTMQLSGYLYGIVFSVSAEFFELKAFIPLQCHSDAPVIDEQKQRIIMHVFYDLHI